MTLLEQTLSKRGRARKTDAPRKKGRIDWWAVREEAWRPGAWNSWREKAIALGMDPKLATQRGKMFALKELTEIEVEAADMWAGMLERNDRWILSARRSPASPALEKTVHGESVAIDEERVQRFKAAFAEAHDVVVRHGMVAEAYLNRLCRDEASSAMLPLVKPVLNALAVHFGLITKGKH